MRNKFIFLPFVFLLGIILLSACSPSKPVETERVISVDRLIKKLEANRRKIKTFRGTGSISINSNSLNAKSNFEVVIKRPDSLKISFYGPFNIDLAQALITSKDFKFYDIINNNLYRGSNKSGVMKQVLKVDMSLNDLVDVLAGSVNLTDKLRKEPDKYESTEDFYRLIYADSINSVMNIYNVRSEDLAITESIVQKFNGTRLFEGKYSRFKSIDDVLVPLEINIEDFANKQRIKVEYRSIEVNKNDFSFKLELPNDVNIIEW